MLYEISHRGCRRGVALALLGLIGCSTEGPEETPPNAATPVVETSASALAIGGRCSEASLAVGDNHTCIVRTGGTVACWGSNSTYQSGQLTTTPVVHPTEVPGLTNVVSVAAGATHTCALINDGTVQCWGGNAAGQLGDGTITKRPAPRAVTGLTGVGAIAAGTSHTCALKNNGTVWCWGSNGSGRLGNNSTTNSSVPVQAIGVTRATMIAAGGSHTLAVTAGGLLYAWGSNAYGQLGDGTTTARKVPTAVNADDEFPFRSIVAGATHTCAIMQAPREPVTCWGRNNLGQLSINSPSVKTMRWWWDDDATTLTGRPVRGVTLGSGANTTCAIDSAGIAQCWGANSQGQVGDGTQTVRFAASPVTAQPPLAGRFLLIGSGLSHTCALAVDGTVYCWGSDTSGQLGDGLHAGRRTTPNAVTGETALTFLNFGLEEQVNGPSGANATSILANGDTLWTAGVSRQTGYEAWLLRRSRDRGANWTTATTWSYQAGSGMGAPHLARAGGGLLFMAGSARNDDGDEHWLVRMSSDQGDTWTEADDFALVDHAPAQLDNIRYQMADDSVYAIGSASDGTITHWILRRADEESPASWSTFDDYTYPGAASTRGHDIAVYRNWEWDRAFAAIGDYTTSSGSHMIVRTPDGTNISTWSTVLDFQAEAGHDTTAAGIAADLTGVVYALSRAETSQGVAWALHRYDYETNAWARLDDVISGESDSEPLGVYVDGAGAVHVYGSITRSGEPAHGVMRVSYDRGATWVTADEVGSNYESAFADVAQDSTGALHVAGFAMDASASSHWTVRSRSCLGLTSACGNGIIDSGELCDGNCSDCNDFDACTTDTIGGSATTCNVTCSHAPVTACTSGDGCCPAGCTVANDLDCCQGRIENGQCVDLSFKITELSDRNCTAYDHNAVAGDDRGGIAISQTNVFYTSDGPNSRGLTARFGAADLLNARSTGKGWNGIVSDLKTGAVYQLANRSTAIGGSGVVNALLTINGATGAQLSPRITLSAAINVVNGQTGIFAGYGRFLIHNGSHVYDVQLPSGLVTDLGPMVLPEHESCENWAFWGVAEYFDHRFYIDYAKNPNIYRTRVPDGETTVLQHFDELSDMCSFTFSPDRRRWYFHHEGDSQFRSGDETIGFCDARFTRPGLPAICGDGITEGDEACDGSDCPTSCSAPNSCTSTSLVGVASSCTAACLDTPITACVNGDGCCPEGCTAAAGDFDCPYCGNGKLDPGELCDGDCPTSCNDGVSCTNDVMTGSPSTCDAVCSWTPVCTSGDGCCAPGCEGVDSDCTCGNGAVDAGEGCDDGNRTDGDGCNQYCQPDPVCPPQWNSWWMSGSPSAAIPNGTPGPWGTRCIPVTDLFLGGTGMTTTFLSYSWNPFTEVWRREFDGWTFCNTAQVSLWDNNLAWNSPCSGNVFLATRDQAGNFHKLPNETNYQWTAARAPRISAPPYLVPAVHLGMTEPSQAWLCSDIQTAGQTCNGGWNLGFGFGTPNVGFTTSGINLTP